MSLKQKGYQFIKTTTAMEAMSPFVCLIELSNRLIKTCTIIFPSISAKSTSSGMETEIVRCFNLPFT